ncbi:MAG: class I SAM-dependent methyltransferase [Chloroflexi bacterium]|nr:class I SAM-dependent methyltransferase [Chloroflexota bacterium]
MPENITNCPLCEHEKSQLFDQRQFREQVVENRLCANCGLVFQSPRMTAAELDTFYAREYRQVYQGAEGPTQKDLVVQNGRADWLLAFLVAQKIAPRRYLDIGASSGILLGRFAEAFNCVAAGIEPGEAYRAYAHKNGLTVFADLSDMRDADEKPFDLISMAHVLEHIPDPVAYLAKLRRDVLIPSGVILIEVPNLYAHESFEIAHMTSFSAHTLRQILTQAGYEVIALKKHGQPRSRLLPLYLTVVASPLASGEHPSGMLSRGPGVRGERNVGFKRRVGMLWRRVLTKLLPKQTWIPVK